MKTLKPIPEKIKGSPAELVKYYEGSVVNFKSTHFFRMYTSIFKSLAMWEKNQRKFKAWGTAEYSDDGYHYKKEPDDLLFSARSLECDLEQFFELVEYASDPKPLPINWDEVDEMRKSISYLIENYELQLSEEGKQYKRWVIEERKKLVQDLKMRHSKRLGLLDSKGKFKVKVVIYSDENGVKKTEFLKTFSFIKRKNKFEFVGNLDNGMQIPVNRLTKYRGKLKKVIPDKNVVNYK